MAEDATIHSDTIDDLRSTTDAVRNLTERLQQIEALKATLEPGDPMLVELADEGVILANELATLTEAQRDLAVEASTEAV